MTIMSPLMQDIRYALRSLLKRPAFTVAAVLSLALGIGANTAIFSVINAVLLRPLPYAFPDQLVNLYETAPNVRSGTVAAANFRDWKDESKSFAKLAVYSDGNVNLQGVSDPERLSTEYASDNIFSLLGVKPMLGRGFLPGEDRDNAPHVAVLSEGFWRRRFGADPRIIGRSITLSGEPYTVVGVMPQDFHFPATKDKDVWLPLQITPEQYAQRGAHMLGVIGRLKPGVEPAAASAEMRQIAARLAVAHPDEQKGRSVLLRPLREDLTRNIRTGLLLLLGASGLVLLIACANVANLLLARASDRRREVAIRLALGAGRGRLIRQLLTESVLLALFGGAVGLILAYGGAAPLVKLAGRGIPFGSSVGFDPTVFAFLLAVAVATGLVFGLIPALQSTRPDLQSDLKEGSRNDSGGVGRQRSRNVLVVAEIALALVLLVSAGLLMRAFLKLQNTDSGMVTKNVLTMGLSVPQTYDSTVSTRFYQPALDRIKAIPGVRSAGVITLLPLVEYGANGTVRIVGRPPDKPGQEPFAEFRVASSGFFTSLGIRVASGRNFTAQDRSDAPIVLIVNNAFSKKYFPGTGAVGQHLLVGDSTVATIVGVVTDIRESGLASPPSPTLFYSYLQAPQYDMSLLVSTTVDPTSLLKPVLAAIHSVDPNQPVFGVKTMDEVVSSAGSRSRFFFWLFGAFAGIALVLAAVGIYGVMTYIVTQRTREIGIRMALGARQSVIMRLIVRHGVSLALAGLAIGTVVALALTRVLASMLYGASATDPVTFLTVVLLLGTVALIASYLPARRAAAVEPVIALRTE